LAGRACDETLFARAPRQELSLAQRRFAERGHCLSPLRCGDLQAVEKGLRKLDNYSDSRKNRSCVHFQSAYAQQELWNNLLPWIPVAVAPAGFKLLDSDPERTWPKAQLVGADLPLLATVRSSSQFELRDHLRCLLPHCGEM
jgi:hypothetical protein